jgi:hypothetical protein
MEQVSNWVYARKLFVAILFGATLIMNTSEGVPDWIIWAILVVAVPCAFIIRDRQDKETKRLHN